MSEMIFIKNKSLLLTIGIIITAVILAVTGFLILPDTLVIQITLSGEAGNTVPKIIGLAIPFLFSTVFSILYYFSKNGKYLFVAGIGILMAILTIVFNMA